MVTIVYEPWREIVIHEATRFSLDDLVRRRTLGVEAGALSKQLLWAEGVLFTYNIMPVTTDTVKEQMQGRIHWSSVQFALMPEAELKEFIIIKETNVKVPVINVNNSPTFRTVANWLKEHAEAARARSLRRHMEPSNYLRSDEIRLSYFEVSGNLRPVDI